MTKQQASILRRLIRSSRHKDRELGSGDRFASKDVEMLEVNRLNDVDEKTAQTLEEWGLVVRDWPAWTGEYTSSYIRFPNLEELDIYEADHKITCRQADKKLY